jgi:hypothetical protein
MINYQYSDHSDQEGQGSSPGMGEGRFGEGDRIAEDEKLREAERRERWRRYDEERERRWRERRRQLMLEIVWYASIWGITLAMIILVSAGGWFIGEMIRGR